MRPANSEKLTLEACVDTLANAVKAEENGADRIELCSNLFMGGLTPDYDLIPKVKEKVNLPIMMMVRPRGGNFYYDEVEVENMKKAIDYAKEMKLEGVVFGCLKRDLTVDIEMTKDLVEYAQPLKVTFHRAFDDLSNQLEELVKLTKIKGIQRILTSGGARTAEWGAKALKELVDTAGNEIVIMPAGKITSQNLNDIHEMIGASEYHGQKIVEEMN